MAKRKSNSVGGLSTGIDNTRLDVVVTERNGDSVVTLQLSTWSDTGGWRVQKTIPLAARQLSQLQRLLAQARNAITDRQTGAGTAAAQVIPIGARRAAAPSLPAAPAKRKTKKAAN
jgi:hypothetical protein